MVVEVGGAVAVVSAAVVVVSVLVVVAAAVLVVVDVVGAVVVVGALVVGSVVVGGSSARAAATAPLPKRTIVASVAISFWRAMGRDYRRFSNVPLYKRSGWMCHPRSYPHARMTDRLVECPAPSRVGRTTTSGEEVNLLGGRAKRQRCRRHLHGRTIAPMAIGWRED